ncbi:MAG: type II toxin-antitoxin system HicB family antitoxin [Burkholderia gladioli]
MATIDRFDGFTVNVYQDDEGDYLAYFVELPSVSAFAATPEEALNELAEAWAGVRESYEKRGEAIPRIAGLKAW